MLRLAICLLTALLAPAAWCAPAGAAQPAGSSDAPRDTVIFAAASLTEAVAAVTKAYENESGRHVTLSFASSSTLARQIENGAAADIFLSADEEWMAYLDKRQLIVTDTWTRPIGNRLVLIAPADLTATVQLRKGVDLLPLLGDGRVATGDPAHVPVGRYAQQALEYLGIWGAFESRLARAENVRAALALVERGEAPLGIVYATDARVAKAVRVVAEFPAESHEPIRYSFAIVREHDGADVRAAFADLTSPAALAIFRQHGFVVP